MNDMTDVQDEHKKFTLDRYAIHTPYDHLYLSGKQRKRIIAQHTSRRWFVGSGEQKALEELRKYASLSNIYKLSVHFVRVIMYFYSQLIPDPIGCNLYHYKLMEMNEQLMYKPPNWDHRRNRMSRMLCRVKLQIKYFKASMKYQIEHNQTALDNGVLDRLYGELFDTIIQGVNTIDRRKFCSATESRDYHLVPIKSLRLDANCSVVNCKTDPCTNVHGKY
eukprot:8278_1